MTTIPLRVYNREIENLIDRGQTEEALAHCKYILNNYPKHIDTYRLLGKAYLETQRYTEAADILQRVLSVLPDDFVSQIGMSIIREDEGNLDAAIYHMKRAYEIQPSNPAIQEELRRLYGRRDGVEPVRLRLTRGALVRMYYRGNLYRQAIAEIKAALNEEPGQLDLEVILAQCYAQSGQRVEATEVCSRLVSRLPYCFEANRILSEILPSTARAEDANVFKERLIALDPYLAFITPVAPTPAEVNDNAVMIERLDWQPSDFDNQQPQWARAAGINLHPEKTETPPDWLTNIHVTPHQPAVTVIEPEAEHPGQKQSDENQPSVEQPVQADIPDWLRSAGWAESTGPEKPPQETFDEKEIEEESSVEAAPAEMPDWLKSLAPSAFDAGQQVEQTSSDETVDRQRLDQPVTGAPQGTEPGIPELPDWLTSFQSEPAQTTGASASNESITEWLSKKTIPESPEEESQQTAEAQFASATEERSAGEETITEWLSKQPLPSFPSEEPQLPQEFESLTPEMPSAAETPSASEESLTEWLSKQPVPSISDDLSVDSKSAEPVVPVDLPISEQRIETPGTGVSAPEAEPAEEIPEWLKDLAPQMEISQPVEESPITEAPPTSPTSDWIPGIPEVESSADSVIPDWLKGLEQEFPIAVEPAPVDQAQTSITEQPLEEHIPENPVSIDEIRPSIETPEETSVLSSTSDATLDWLQSLSTEQPHTEEAVTTPVESSIPEWLRFDEIPEAKPEEEVSADAEIQSESLPIVGIPEEPLATIVEENGQTEAVEPLPEITFEISTEVEALPFVETSAGVDTLKPVEEVTLQPTSETPTEIPVEEVSLPATSSLVEPPSAPTEEITQPSEFEKVEISREPSLLDQHSEEAFTWLESLAARQGALEEELLTRPEDRREAPPDWVIAEQSAELSEEKPAEHENMEEIEPHLVQPVEFEPPAPAPEPLPAWLQDLPAQAAEGPAIPVEHGGETTPLHEEIVPPDTQPEAEPDVIPAWVENAQTATIEESNAPVEVIPEWLKDLQPPSPVPVEPFMTAEEEESSTKPVAVGASSVPPLPDDLRHEAEEAEKEIAAANEDEDLRQARADLKKGLVDEALEQYNQFIQNNEHLEETIHDLREALYLYPVDVTIWQALGDAYFRTNRIQDAMDAYTKAEELLR